jgi:hypothetical protein
VLQDPLKQLLTALRAHTGKNIGGLDFSESYDGWKSSVEEPFLMHLNDIFCTGAPTCFVCLFSNHPLAREDCITRALPKRVGRNTAAPSLAESSRLPTSYSINAASSNRVIESERGGSYEPENMVSALLLV